MPVIIFFCYARKDETLLKKLKVHLKPLQREGLIDVLWHDGDISAGTEWEREISKYLNEAQIILLLISPDFIASEYCYSKEMLHAIERHNQGEALVIPILLRPVYWHRTPFSNLQVLPPHAKPVTDPYWVTQDRAFLKVTEAIRIAVQKLTLQHIAEPILTDMIPEGEPEKPFAEIEQSEQSISRNASSSHLPQQLKSIAEGNLRDNEDQTLNKSFLKWLEKVSARPKTYKGEACQGLVNINHITAVSPFEAKQLHSEKIIAGDSVRCWLKPIGDRTNTLFYCFANDPVASLLFDFQEESMVEVTVKCLGQLKVYETIIDRGDEERGVSYPMALLILGLKDRSLQ